MSQESIILNFKEIKFILRDRRLYGIGNAYVSSTRTIDTLSRKIRLNRDEETEIDICVKYISLNEKGDSVIFYDTKNERSEIIIHDDIVHYTSSLIQSNTGKFLCAICTIAAIGIGYKFWHNKK